MRLCRVGHTGGVGPDAGAAVCAPFGGKWYVVQSDEVGVGDELVAGVLIVDVHEGPRHAAVAAKQPPPAVGENPCQGTSRAREQADMVGNRGDTTKAALLPHMGAEPSSTQDNRIES